MADQLWCCIGWRAISKYGGSQLERLPLVATLAIARIKMKMVNKMMQIMLTMAMVKEIHKKSHQRTSRTVRQHPHGKYASLGWSTIHRCVPIYGTHMRVGVGGQLPETLSAVN